ncbi:sterol-binding protein [Shewanella maritima]|uniref:Ubiquinone biosynthesis accessory factor UbiJ n=1 Tax=Shewanella maritima TaxID=2520507 RepID=A0A411PJB1_9GAMM|nr:SCP2 sterol-binding domain-containing protein [Shewanella maritima]QBF83578.1 sterol-binding protein [Shewanella maritima]
MALNHFALLTCSAIETAFAALPTQAKMDYAKLKNLHGKVFCIQLSQLSWPMYLVFAKQLQVLSRYEGEVDVRVDADASTLYQIKEGANLTELIKQDKLRLEGDIQLLQTFSHFVQHIDFDIAEPLSKYVGDGPTHMLTEHSKWLAKSAKQVFGKSLDHIGQLATEEFKVAVHKIEYLHFCDNLEDLSKDAESLANRVTLLTRRLS